MSLSSIAGHDRKRWHAIASAALRGIETRLFIDGAYVDALKGGRFATVNPATGEQLAEMALGHRG